MTEKEIGMGKLMKYVEEMQKEGINICRPRFQEYYLLEMMLISKYYGLIKWLVENDKIDREQFYDKARKIITDFDLRGEYEGACNEIIMLLSISDTPIDLLCSLLK